MYPSTFRTTITKPVNYIQGKMDELDKIADMSFERGEKIKAALQISASGMIDGLLTSGIWLLLLATPAMGIYSVIDSHRKQ